MKRKRRTCVTDGLESTRRDFLKQASLLVTGAQAALWLPPLVESGRAADEATEAIAETTTGKIRGRKVDGINGFLGVPYGGPTTGRRYQRASKPEPWTGVRDALEFGNRCPFAQTSNNPNWNNPPGKESDDCLVLNVWTPGLNDKGSRAIMLWLHGGGFTTGAASYPNTNGAKLAKRGDVVVVTINHRIGFLGYCNLAELGGEKYADSGNIGQLDAILALQWVKENAASFGGDPSRVTIFGQSGGGAKVSTLLAMPEARSLFHRAIIQSGAGLRGATPDAATKSAELFLNELGISKNNVDEIQKLPWEKLKAAQLSLEQKRAPIRWSPVVDGRVLPRHPFDPDAPLPTADVPIMVGATRTETTYSERPILDQIYALDLAGVKARLMPNLGDDTDRLLELYKGYYPQATPPELYFYIASDSGAWFRSVTLAERKASQHRGPVYMYVYDWVNPNNPKMKSPHGGEISFVFDNVGSDQSDDAIALAAKLSGAWSAFAKTGYPNVGNTVWGPYTRDTRSIMMLGANIHVERDPWKEARKIYTDRRNKAAAAATTT